MRARLVVNERNDPLVVIWITQIMPDKTQVPYDFEGATVEYFQKEDSLDLDGAALYSTVAGSIVVAAAPPWDAKGIPIVSLTQRNRITVQMSSANLVGPDVKFFRVDAIKNSKRETVIKGSLVIESI